MAATRACKVLTFLMPAVNIIIDLDEVKRLEDAPACIIDGAPIRRGLENLFIRTPVLDQLVSARDLAVSVGKAKSRADLVGELRGRNWLAFFKRLEPTAKGVNKNKTIFIIVIYTNECDQAKF